MDRPTPPDVDLHYTQRSPLLWDRLKAKLNGPVEVRTLRSALGEDLLQRTDAICGEIESLLEILLECRSETAEEINAHRRRRDIAASLAPSGIEFMNAHIRMIVEGGLAPAPVVESRRPHSARTASSVRHVDPLQGVPMSHLRFDKVFHESTWMVTLLRESLEEEWALLVTDADWIRKLILDERSYRNHVTQKLTNDAVSSSNVATLRTMTRRVQHAARVQALPHITKSRLEPLSPPTPAPPPGRREGEPFQRAVTDTFTM